MRHPLDRVSSLPLIGSSSWIPCSAATSQVPVTPLPSSKSFYVKWKTAAQCPCTSWLTPTAAKGDTSMAAGLRQAPPPAAKANPPEPAPPSAAPPTQTNGVHAPPGPGRGYFPKGGRRGFVPGFRGGRGGAGFIPSPLVAEEESWVPWAGSKIFYGTPALIVRVLHECIWGFLGQVFVTSILAWGFGLAVFRILTSA